jgi:hypothetical protein
MAAFAWCRPERTRTGAVEAVCRRAASRIGGGSEDLMPARDGQATIEAIAALAEEIARASPESADKAMRILDLLKGLGEDPDLPAIADAIDAGTAGSLSDTEVRSASLEVGRAIREKP